MWTCLWKPWTSPRMPWTCLDVLQPCAHAPSKAIFLLQPCAVAPSCALMPLCSCTLSCHCTHGNVYGCPGTLSHPFPCAPSNTFLYPCALLYLPAPVYAIDICGCLCTLAPCYTLLLPCAFCCWTLWCLCTLVLKCTRAKVQATVIITCQVEASLPPQSPLGCEGMRGHGRCRNKRAWKVSRVQWPSHTLLHSCTLVHLCTLMLLCRLTSMWIYTLLLCPLHPCALHTILLLRPLTHLTFVPSRVVAPLFPASARAKVKTTDCNMFG